MSAYLAFGPYVCRECKEEYDIIHTTERVIEWKFGHNPEFATFRICEECGIKEVVERLKGLLKKDRVPEYLFRELVSLEDSIDDWTYLQRDKCSGCKHERDGCQIHD